MQYRAQWEPNSTLAPVPTTEMARSGRPWEDCTTRTMRRNAQQLLSPAPSPLRKTREALTVPDKRSYSPPTVSPSILIVGEAVEPRNSRSFPTSEILKKISFKFPATVISSTGYASSPPEIHIPEAPRE